jgi:hypothetical protein
VFAVAMASVSSRIRVLELFKLLSGLSIVDIKLASVGGLHVPPSDWGRRSCGNGPDVL